MATPTPNKSRSQETRRELIEAKFAADPKVVRLSAQDSRRIANALLDPPEPTPALRDAVRRYRELMGG